MQILFLAHRLPYPPNKGDKIRSFWELATLSKQHEIDLFCFYDDPQDRFEVAKLSSYCHSYYAEPISTFGSRFHAVSALVRGRPFSPGFFYSTTMARRIAASVKSQSYDVIFVFGSVMAQYAEPYSHLPRLIDLVDVDSDKWFQYSCHSRSLLSRLWKLEGRRLQMYESAIVQSSANTLVCTEAEARLLRLKAQNGVITVMQNSLDTTYYHPASVSIPASIRALQPYVIFTGSMDYFPNIDAVRFFVQDVWPVIRERVPNLRFVVAGRNPSAEVMQLASRKDIEVTGSVPDIRPYLSGAAVAVAPMRIARGVQNKILEALAMDVPVVASSVAAKALPAELASLLDDESEPLLLAARVASAVLNQDGRKCATHARVKRYIETLDLPSQLARLINAAVASHSGVVKEASLELTV